MGAVSPIPEATWFYALAILTVGAAAVVAAWLCRGAFRHREQALRGNALDIDQPGCAVDEHTCLTATRARNDERWFRW